MRFSVWPNLQQPWEDVVELCRHAEATGWDGAWVADHFMPVAGDVGTPTSECWSTLAALAVAVPRIRLGALVSGNTYRHPAVLANVAATVDRISGGRLVLGIGAGWQENEHEAYGLHFGTVKERLERLGEACEVLKGLLTQDRTTFEGRYYTLRDAPLEPKPAQSPLPLLVGGGGERVTLRIAARWADEWNTWGPPETLRHKMAVLDRHCEELGRDPVTITRSAQALLVVSDDREELDRARGTAARMPTIVGTPAEVRDVMAAYADAGVDEFILPDRTLGTGTRRLDALDAFLSEVAADLR